MSVIKVEIRKILSKQNDSTEFEGTYTRGHAFFSPRGFIATVQGEDYKEGDILYYDNKKIKIRSFGEGTKEILEEFAKKLEEC